MNERRHWPLRLLLGGLAALAVGCGTTATDATLGSPRSASDDVRPVVTVHRSPTCSCCGAYEEYLATHGFEVVVEEHDDMAPYKQDQGIPAELWSCHTNEVDGYLAEGHVPVEALEELLAQRPDIDGIALPGMPAGSPGMPGAKEGPFVVTAFDQGEVTATFGSY